jgi:hypothetical protein
MADGVGATWCRRIKYLGPSSEGWLMRSRFVFLLVGAVVFAPGWHGGGASEHPRGSDLAARVLAPTVDEGAIREEAHIEHQLSGRHAKRWRTGITFEALVTLGLGALTSAIFWVIASYSGHRFDLFRRHFHTSRAPPLLQPR